MVPRRAEAAMLDRRARAALQPLLTALVRPLHRLGIVPGGLTGAGLLVGAGACVAAGAAAWNLALGLWLANRLLDGLDGPLARLRAAEGAGGPSELGGFVDLVADFSVYGGFVVGCAVGQPDARIACLVLLLAYYVNGAAVLAQAGLVERRAAAADDDRSVVLVGGLAEGAETIVAHSLMALLPGWLDVIAWVFAGMVAVTVVQRLVHAARALR